MALNIVLFEPEIPNNTGNIGRLALGTGCNLHLVKPYGFEISDKKLKRAGLDYWPHINLREYNSVEDFFAQHPEAKFAFFSSKGERSFWEIPYQDDLFLVFGKESKGLDEWITDKYARDTYQIPMFSDKIRSFNIANAVAIAVYEGIRRLKG